MFAFSGLQELGPSVYDAPMFNALLPPIYRRLRQRTGLSQAELAAKLGIGRTKMVEVEKGTARLSLEQEEELLALAKCSRREAIEMLCEEVSEAAEAPIGLLGEDQESRPSINLARARRTARRLDGRLPVSRLRTLNNQIHTAQLATLLCERSSADLEELMSDCVAEAEIEAVTDEMGGGNI